MTWERPTLGTARDNDGELDHRANLPAEPVTLQTVFDRVVKHLRTQGRKSIESHDDPNGLCRYRAPDGCSCAVGCLIRDDVYDQYSYGTGFGKGNRLEGHDVYSGDVLEALKASGIEPTFAPILKDLQRVHDQTPPEDWESGLADVARFYNLEFTTNTKEGN